MTVHCELEITPDLGRGEQMLGITPVVSARAPHRLFNADEPRKLLCRVAPGTSGRDHRVHEGKSYGSPGAAQESAPRKVSACDDLHDGTLSVIGRGLDLLHLEGIALHDPQHEVGNLVAIRLRRPSDGPDTGLVEVFDRTTDRIR